MNRLALRAIASLVATILAISPAKAQLEPVPLDLDASETPIALLVDASTGQVLFERQAERRFVPASITKVMTLYTA
ncbi:MAG: D-alanyl-D-alanine carboxypeptidase, partial [Pseudomonadota bacterium]